MVGAAQDAKRRCPVDGSWGLAIACSHHNRLGNRELKLEADIGTIFQAHF